MPIDKETVREILAGACLVMVTASAAWRGDSRLLYAIATVTAGYLFRNELATIGAGIRSVGGGIWRRIRRRS